MAKRGMLISRLCESEKPPAPRGGVTERYCWAPPRGVIRGHLKYVELPIPELYDLAADPHEMTNLAAARIAEVEASRVALRAFPSGPVRAGSEHPDSSARLRSLGYVSGGFSAHGGYTEADDPKRLIGVDRDLQRIVASYQAGDTAAALSRAHFVAQRNPRMPIAWLQLAHLQRESGDLTGGIASLRRGHALDPANVQIAALLGAYLTQSGAADQAAAVVTPLAAGQDADVEILRGLALADARRGAFDAARAALARARALDAGELQLLIDQGTIELMADRRDAARAAFEQALAHDPSLTRAHSSLAAIAADEGRPADAATHWREAVARDPAEYGRVFALGVAQARGGRTAQARMALEFFAAGAPPERYAREIAQARAWLANPR